jgi:GxxExxY protein
MRIEEFHSRRVPAGEEVDELTEAIIGALIEVHRVLGPGLTEIMYENAVCNELKLRSIKYARQVPVAVEYKGKSIGDTRLDIVVEDKLILELKACETLNSVHRAQVICYLRATKLKIGLLVNFNVSILKDGIKRVVLS